MLDMKDIRPFEQDRVNIDSNIAIIRIGTKSQTFHIHEPLLTRSAFFRHKLAARKTTKNLQLHLSEGDEDAAATFSLWVHLIYFNSLPCKTSGKGDLPMLEEVDAEQTATTRLYLLAQKLGDIEAMDSAISTLIVVCQKSCVDKKGRKYQCTLPSAEVVGLVYASPMAASPMRRLMVDIHLAWAEGEHIDAKLPVLFVVDCARAVMEKLRGGKKEGGPRGSLGEGGGCEYHMHAVEAVCPVRQTKQESDEHESIEEGRDNSIDDGSFFRTVSLRMKKASGNQARKQRAGTRSDEMCQRGSIGDGRP